MTPRHAAPAFFSDAARLPNEAMLVATGSWSATLIGVEALRRGGWTPQVSWRWDVALHADDAVAIPPRFRVVRRPLHWFHTILPGLVRPRVEGELFCLRPVWALADLLAHERRSERGPSWFGGLNPDDVQPIETTSAERADWLAACVGFGLDAQAEARGLAQGGSTAELV